MKQIISAIRGIESLSLVFHSIEKVSIPHLTDFHGLRSVDITLQPSTSEELQDFINMWARCIGANSLLENVSIVVNTPATGRNIKMFDIFKYCTSEGPLPLRRLTLSGIIPCFDSTTLPHLLSLRSLKIGWYAEPKFVHPEYSLERCIGTGTKITEFSGPLRDIGTIRYLASYSGLKQLVLWSGRNHPRRRRDAQLEQFFDALLDTVIPMHADTLVDITFEGAKWCCPSTALAVFATCRNLRHFGWKITCRICWDSEHDASKRLILIGDGDQETDPFVRCLPCLVTKHAHSNWPSYITLTRRTSWNLPTLFHT